jgi:hypothetical protein
MQHIWAPDPDNSQWPPVPSSPLRLVGIERHIPEGRKPNRSLFALRTLQYDLRILPAGRLIRSETNAINPIMSVTQYQNNNCFVCSTSVRSSPQIWSRAGRVLSFSYCLQMLANLLFVKWIQHKLCIYFQYTCSQNKTNDMWGGITV